MRAYCNFASKQTISITLFGPRQNKKNRTPKKTLKRCYTRRFATTTFSATQRCNIVGTLFLAVATLCCAKNRSYESSRVTSPLNRIPSCFSLWQQLRLLDNHYHWRYLEWVIQYFTVPRTDKPVVLQVSQLTEDTSDRIVLWKCWVLRRGEIWSKRRKRLGANEKPYNKLQLHVQHSVDARTQAPRPWHWWESSDRWRSPLACEDRDSLSLRWMPDYSLEIWQLSNRKFVWFWCKLEFKGILGCSFCFQRDINRIKSLDCCKGLLNSLTINIEHFFVQSWCFNVKLFEKMPGFIDLCRHRSHPASPYYAAGVKCNATPERWFSTMRRVKTYVQSMMMTSNRTSSLALMHLAYKFIQRDTIDTQRESRTGSVRRSQNWVYSFSKYTPFRSWLWPYYSFATIYVRLLH